MPRLRADDYAVKKTQILDAAANLFAHQGYTGCKMQDIAAACGVSKSMLYHYFVKKEDVLFEILRQHLDRILTVLNEYMTRHPDESLDAFFYGFVESYLERSQMSRARHVVALHDRLYLTKAQHKEIVGMERKIVVLVEEVLRRVDPSRDDVEYRPHALLLLGMINWVELWYRREGKVSPGKFYSMITRLYLHGFAPR